MEGAFLNCLRHFFWIVDTITSYIFERLDDDILNIEKCQVYYLLQLVPSLLLLALTSVAIPQVGS